MKRIFLLLFLSTSTFGLFAQGTPQNPPAQNPQQVPATQAQPYQATPITIVQAKPEFPFQFGFIVAPNVSWMKPTADEYTKKGSQLGIALGLIGEYKFSENYALQFGVRTVSTGGKLVVTRDIDANILSKSVKRSYNLRYIELPFTLKMMTNEINKVQYFFQVGLGTSISYRTKGEDEYDGTAHAVNINKNIRFFKESFLLGIGAQTKVSGQTKVFAGLMFNNGFTNILKGTDKLTTGGVAKDLNPSAINNYVELNLGILF